MYDSRFLFPNDSFSDVRNLSLVSNDHPHLQDSFQASFIFYIRRGTQHGKFTCRHMHTYHVRVEHDTTHMLMDKRESYMHCSAHGIKKGWSAACDILSFFGWAKRKQNAKQSLRSPSGRKSGPKATSLVFSVFLLLHAQRHKELLANRRRPNVLRRREEVLHVFLRKRLRRLAPIRQQLPQRVRVQISLLVVIDAAA